MRQGTSLCRETDISVLGRQYRWYRCAGRWILDKRGHGLALVWSKGGNIDESRDLGIVACRSDHYSAVGMAYEDHPTVLRGDSACGYGDIVG
jgi:hypothetical protein